MPRAKPSRPLDRTFKLRGASRFLDLGTSGDGRLHVVEFAPARRPEIAVIALPFTAAHGRQVRPFCEAMAERGSLAVAVDLPGHGRSEGARGWFQIERLIETIAALGDHYHSRCSPARIVLAGSSWGGDLALLTAVYEAERQRRTGRIGRIAAVVAQAVVTPWQREVFKTFRPGVGVLFEPHGWGRWLARRALGRRLSVRSMFQVSELYSDRRLQRRFARDPLRLRGYDADSYLDYLTYQPCLDLPDWRLPILLTVGENDRLVAPDYERRVYDSLRRLNPSAELCVVPGGSHTLFEENAETMAKTAAEWLARVSTRDRS